MNWLGWLICNEIFCSVLFWLLNGLSCGAFASNPHNPSPPAQHIMTYKMAYSSLLSTFISCCTDWWKIPYQKSPELPRHTVLRPKYYTFWTPLSPSKVRRNSYWCFAPLSLEPVALGIVTLLGKSCDVDGNLSVELQVSLSCTSLCFLGEMEMRALCNSIRSLMLKFN